MKRPRFFSATMRLESQHRSPRPSSSSSSWCDSRNQSRLIPSAHTSAMYVDLISPSTKVPVDIHIVQLVNELSIADGDRRKVGYYMGLIVRPPNPDPTNLRVLTEVPISSSSCPYIMSPKRPPCCNGAVFPITSVASPFSC